ncbi:MAG: RCC1 domain-containing protein [Kofleriaceae bacterium]
MRRSPYVLFSFIVTVATSVSPACEGGRSPDPTGTEPDGGMAMTDAPEECVPACGARECGLDPVCGTPCGTCNSGETCSASGRCQSGQPTCTPTTCAAQGAECGIIADGCGNTLTCGSCTGGETCGAMSPNKCDPGVCTPRTCLSAGAECGTIDDGCGDPLQCGTCTGGEMCGIGGQPNVCSPPPALWTKISNGGFHTCAIKNDGTLWCWGSNNYGQLGLGTMGGTMGSPQRVGVSFGWTDIASGGFHTCGINYDHLYCWGNNDSNQLGDGTTTDTATPKLIQGAKTFNDVKAGWAMSCARSGDQYCWGNNDYLALSSDLGPVTTPDYSGDFYTEVALGGAHACFKRDGVTSTSLSCGGLNSSGQLGINNGNQNSPRASVQPTREWNRIFAGGQHSCGLANVGTLFCWGSNQYGQLGNPQAITVAPDYVDGFSDWREMGLGDMHTCGVKQNGNLYCWGLGDEGQLGIGTMSNRDEPALVGSGFKTVSGGYAHTCALDTMSKLYCWGSNDYGQLGAGSGTATSPRAVP